MSQRTKRQERADTFDCDLYRLIQRALNFADDDLAGRTWWDNTARLLNEARPMVRHLMSAEDRERSS